jgi:hypothetical protein
MRFDVSKKLFLVFDIVPKVFRRFGEFPWQPVVVWVYSREKSVGMFVFFESWSETALFEFLWGSVGWEKKSYVGGDGVEIIF